MRQVLRPILVACTVGMCVLAVWVPCARGLVSTGGGFYFQSPQQFGWSYGALAFADADNVWATGGTQNNGTRLLHSSDGGTTWQAVDADPDPDRADWFDDLTFVDAQHARATTSWYDKDTSTDQIGLVKSDDDGATWSMTPIATGGWLGYGARFPSADEAVVCGREYNATAKKWNFVMLTTRDGGASWTRSDLPGEGVYDIWTRDMVHIWYSDVSENHTIYTSADGGASWQKHGLPDGTEAVERLQAIDATHAWALVFHLGKPNTWQVLTTADGGDSWTMVKSLPAHTWPTLTAADAHRAYLTETVSSVQRNVSSCIEHTTDGGASWQRTYLGPEIPHALSVSPDGTLFGWVQGLWRSGDSGASWQRLIGSRHGYMLEGVTATSQGKLWAVGETTPLAPDTYDPTSGQGVLFSSSDGARWQQVPIAGGASLRTIDFFGARYGFAAGSSGRVLHTSTGGKSWQAARPVGKDLVVKDVEATGPRSAVAVVTRIESRRTYYGIARTTDAGASWRLEHYGRSDRLTAICAAGAKKLVAVGGYGRGNVVVLTSTDGGASWRRTVVTGCKWEVRDVAFTDAEHGCVLTSTSADWTDWQDWGSVVLRTTNGGKSWTKIDLGQVSTYSLTSLTFSGAKTGWAVGDRILKTTDGGASWHDTGAAVPDAGTSHVAEAALFGVAASRGHVWAVGAGQLILSTLDTSADTAAPVTCDDGDRLWHNAAVTTHLTATDAGGSGVKVTQYRIDGGRWQTLTAAGVTVKAPSDHSADGDHTISYRSTDKAGNTEFPQLCTVHIDTRPPKTVAYGKVTVARGSTAKIAYKITDAQPNGGTATVTITVRDAAGTTVDTLVLGEQEIGKKLRAAYACALAPGSYTYRVTATDAAGNAQSSAGSGTLVVTD